MPTVPQNERVSQIVEAQIIATHAYQVALADKVDRKCWANAGLTHAGLEELVAHQRSLLSKDPRAIRAWMEGGAGGHDARGLVSAASQATPGGQGCPRSTFDPEKDLLPILSSLLKVAAPTLPVNIFTGFLLAKTGCTPIHARAVASLLQMQLDINRDGDRLQEIYALYVALGLPVHTERLGWPARTDEEFLAAAGELVLRFCACPFDTDARTVGMLFRKMWNWGHRYTGERDKTTLAGELLKEPDVATLIPKIERMPEQKIAVIGHSYTMNLNWSSPSSFVPVSIEVLSRHNPRVQVRQWQAGGMNPARADFQKFCDEALAWKPDHVLFVIAFYGKDDPAALEQAASRFAAAGAKVEMFDSLYGKAKVTERFYVDGATLDALARKAGLTVIQVEAALNASPDLDRFVSLDGVHMTEPYHRLMAKQWLAFLCGA